MLKALFSSRARVKLLKMFLLHPDNEYYVREITRKLGEQINSIRRELQNFKKIGLVKFRTKNRKKYFFVNKDFLLYDELRSMVIKTQDIKEDIVEFVKGLGNVHVVAISGVLVGNPEGLVDLLIVGDNLNKEELEAYLDELPAENRIRYALMSKEDFLYRIQYNDSFLEAIFKDKKTLIPVNHFKQILK